jgi:hypothetical protein
LLTLSNGEDEKPFFVIASDGTKPVTVTTTFWPDGG